MKNSSEFQNEEEKGMGLVLGSRQVKNESEAMQSKELIWVCFTSRIPRFAMFGGFDCEWVLLMRFAFVCGFDFWVLFVEGFLGFFVLLILGTLEIN